MTSLIAAIAQRGGSRTLGGLALVVTLALAATIAFAQPWNSPWWTYADADGAYVGSSLNLLDGYPTRNLDHPGLPVQQLDELAFGGEWVGKALTGSRPSP